MTAAHSPHPSPYPHTHPTPPTARAPSSLSPAVQPPAAVILLPLPARGDRALRAGAVFCERVRGGSARARITSAVSAGR